MNEVHARLIIKRGPSPDQEYRLATAEVTIGRGSTNVIPIADPEVSRRHACIKWENNQYIIEDWASTNGTFLNDRRISGPVVLHNGDEIKLGDTILLHFINDEEPVQLIPEDRYPEKDAVTVVEARPTDINSVTAPAAPPEATREDAVPEPIVLPEQTVDRGSFRRRALGCGCGFIFVIFLCMSTIYFLDAYEQGVLLYCGPLRPFFEIILGPFGFSPICP